MNSDQIFQLQIACSLLVFTLVAVWYVQPRLAPLPLKDALTPLLLLHATRTVGLTMVVPAVVDPTLPRAFATPAAYGDLIAAGLALLSIFALRANLRIAPATVWIFSLVGIGDLVNGFIQGYRAQVPHYQIGAAWFIYTVLVPALLVTHVMIVARLIRLARTRGGVPIGRAGR